MQLTQFTDYTLRIMMYLAQVPEPGMATIAEIADHFQISKDHLMKAAHLLGSKGLLVTTRGRGGGLRLAKPAQSITIGAVVRQTEPHLHLVECFEMSTNTCRLASQCALKRMLHESTAAFLKVLDHYTLAEAAEMKSYQSQEEKIL